MDNNKTGGEWRGGEGVSTRSGGTAVGSDSANITELAEQPQALTAVGRGPGSSCLGRMPWRCWYLVRATTQQTGEEGAGWLVTQMNREQSCGHHDSTRAGAGPEREEGHGGATPQEHHSKGGCTKLNSYATARRACHVSPTFAGGALAVDGAASGPLARGDGRSRQGSDNQPSLSTAVTSSSPELTPTPTTVCTSQPAAVHGKCT